MAKTVSDALIDRLHAWGVRRLFGYPGDGIDGVFDALNRSNGKFEFVQARHGEMATFMACGHAQFTGAVGACIATSGPGAIHLRARSCEAIAMRSRSPSPRSARFPRRAG